MSFVARSRSILTTPKRLLVSRDDSTKLLAEMKAHAADLYRLSAGRLRGTVGDVCLFSATRSVDPGSCSGKR